MSKKDNLQLTPEEITAKKIRRSNGWTRFWAMLLALALTVGVFTFAKSQGKKESEKAKETTTAAKAASAQDSSSWDSGSDSATPQGSSDGSGSGSDSNQNADPSTQNEAETVAKLLNAATAKAASAGYDWSRNCVVKDIDVGSATETLNGIIHRVDENSDLNSVVGGFLGQGDLSGTITKGGDAKEVTGSANYPLKATTLTAADIKNLSVDGNTYTFALSEATDPQKDNSTPLSRFTNDFITQDEVATGIKDALGGLSFLISVKSSTVVIKDIKIKAVIKDGNLESLAYEYYMDVQKLELSVATGTGNGTIKGSYSNFKY